MKKDGSRDGQVNSTGSATRPLELRAITTSAADSPKKFSEIAAKLQVLADDAVETLRAGLLSVSDSSSIRAASTILRLWAEFEQMSEIERRVALLENRRWKK